MGFRIILFATALKEELTGSACTIKIAIGTRPRQLWWWNGSLAMNARYWSLTCAKGKNDFSGTKGQDEYRIALR